MLKNNIVNKVFFNKKCNFQCKIQKGEIMKLFIITGTCGAGKSTVIDEIKKRIDSEKFVCFDADNLGLNWWNYSGTDHEYKYADDCLQKSVELSNGKNIIFSSCLNPLDYFRSNTAPIEITETYYILLLPGDKEVEDRLKARPEKRGFTTPESRQPHIEYNKWFRRNKNKFNLCIDTTATTIDDTTAQILLFISKISQ